MCAICNKKIFWYTRWVNNEPGVGVSLPAKIFGEMSNNEPGVGVSLPAKIFGEWTTPSRQAR
jgi:hypothetical protein